MNYKLVKDKGKLKFIKIEEINQDFRMTKNVFSKSSLSLSSNIIDSMNIIFEDHIKNIENSKNLIELEDYVNDFLKTFPAQLIVGGFNIPVNWISQNAFFEKMNMISHSKVLKKAINKRNDFLKRLL